ncbi:hypothetical protein LX36DRAFT_374266 [Colletotrichum falcatum]|nr:hypothetical protein LX36DRAFT_374266 [Colletotrichum falcatum]
MQSRGCRCRRSLGRHRRRLCSTSLNSSCLVLCQTLPKTLVSTNNWASSVLCTMVLVNCEFGLSVSISYIPPARRLFSHRVTT